MSGITSHVLDTARGRPAAGLGLGLHRRGEDGGWIDLGSGPTDADGRRTVLAAVDGVVPAGVYRLVFDVGAWFAVQDTRAFYPEVAITFEIRDGTEHHHVPLLLSPFGYSTYRGS